MGKRLDASEDHVLLGIDSNKDEHLYMCFTVDGAPTMSDAPIGDLFGDDPLVTKEVLTVEEARRRFPGSLHAIQAIVNEAKRTNALRVDASGRPG